MLLTYAFLMPAAVLLLLSSSSFSSSSSVSGSSKVYTGSQNLACVRAAPPTKTKRDTLQLGINLLGVLMAPLTGGLSIPLAIAVSSVTYHELVYYKNYVFEWGEGGLHIGKTSLVPGCELKWKSYASSNVDVQHVIYHAKQYNLYGRYDMFSNNCHHFARYLYDFLLMPWTSSESPIYFYSQKASECRFKNNANKLEYVRYNSTFIGWNDADEDNTNTTLTTTTRFFLRPSRPYFCTVYINTVKVEKTSCPIAKIADYGTEYPTLNREYATELGFHSSTLFRNRLLHYMKYTCLNSPWKRYEVGVQYGGCIVGGPATSRTSLYYPRLLFEDKVFHWDMNVNFVYSDQPLIERCPVQWDYDPVGSMDRTSSVTLCSLKDAVSYGLIYRFFKGPYHSKTNKGYTFIDNLARWLYDDCKYKRFPCTLNFDSGCPDVGRDVFVTFYQRFRGTKGIFFNTCYDYNNAYKTYVDYGWCTFITDALRRFDIVGTYGGNVIRTI